jgi:hypothetical protein
MLAVVTERNVPIKTARASQPKPKPSLALAFGPRHLFLMRRIQTVSDLVSTPPFHITQLTRFAAGYLRSRIAPLSILAPSIPLIPCFTAFFFA